MTISHSLSEINLTNLKLLEVNVRQTTSSWTKSSSHLAQYTQVLAHSGLNLIPLSRKGYTVGHWQSVMMVRRTVSPTCYMKSRLPFKFWTNAGQVDSTLTISCYPLEHSVWMASKSATRKTLLLCGQLQTWLSKELPTVPMSVQTRSLPLTCSCSTMNHLQVASTFQGKAVLRTPMRPMLDSKDCPSACWIPLCGIRCHLSPQMKILSVSIHTIWSISGEVIGNQMLMSQLDTSSKLRPIWTQPQSLLMIR